jgi:hypothetical protein
MSTINAANITDGTDTVATGYVVNGSEKCWCMFNGTGTIAIQNSLNVSSLYDQGTGDYDINLTSSLNANNGAHVCWSSTFHTTRSSNGSASTIEIYTAGTNHSGQDTALVVGTTRGDLA